MSHTAGAIRMVIAAAVLMGGTLGMLGQLKQASINQVFLRAPRTESEQRMPVLREPAPVAAAPSDFIVVRGRGETRDPCIPIAPVSWLTPAAVLC